MKTCSTTFARSLSRRLREDGAELLDAPGVVLSAVIDDKVREAVPRPILRQARQQGLFEGRSGCLRAQPVLQPCGELDGLIELDEVPAAIEQL